MPRKEKIVIIGAGSLQFGLGSVGSILESEILSESTISLHDINPDTLNLAFQACQAAIDERKLDITVEQAINRLEALKDATFIINSIEVPPRFDLLRMDYEIPRGFGSNQVTGENGGPGGFFHSLRVIPPILDICEDINKICPNALIINYSNPMSRICLAIKRKFPSLKFVGLCHEFHHFMPLVSRILKTPLSNLEIRGAGLNHFGVLLDIKYRDSGSDAYPELRKNGPEFLSNLDTYDGFKFVSLFLETYGYVPYTTDSHYGEYIHWAWDKADITAIRRFWENYEILLIKSFKKLKRFIEKGKGARFVKPDEERGIPIIEDILSDANHEELSVNIPNDNIISNLPRDLVVECPAIVNKDGLKGINLGEYPKSIIAYLNTQASVQDLVVKAIINESKDLALQALLLDPVVGSYSEAKKTLDKMLELQKDYIQITLE